MRLRARRLHVPRGQRGVVVRLRLDLAGLPVRQRVGLEGVRLAVEDVDGSDASLHEGGGAVQDPREVARDAPLRVAQGRAVGNAGADYNRLKKQQKSPQ